MLKDYILFLLDLIFKVNKILFQIDLKQILGKIYIRFLA